ncbi:MAG: hypothetical protein HY401_03165 [Elusimicrobia bacterium]|nr:hypothetical protein [Elusimicrobiota bacterium]
MGINCKKIAIAGIAAIVALTVMEFFAHSVVLKNIYMRPEFFGLWNSEEAFKSRQWAMFLAYVVTGVFFAKIYAYGYEPSRSPLGQGLRYGLMVGALFAGSCLIQYMVYPVPLSLALAWIVVTFIETAVLGVIVAHLYKP